MPMQDVVQGLAPQAEALSAAARGAQGVPAGGQPQAASLQELLLQLTGGGQVDPEMLMQLLALLSGAGGVPAGAPPAAADEDAIAAAFMGR